MAVITLALAVTTSTDSGTQDAAYQNANAGPVGLGIIWMLVFLSLCVICMRIYTQLVITGQFGASDCLMLASISVLITFASLISVQYTYGWGRHQSTLDSENLEMLLKYNVISQGFGIFGSTFGRLSFIIFMIRLFGSAPANRRLRYSFWLLFILQLLTNGVALICIYVSCDDPRGLYNFAVAAETKCWPQANQTYIGYAHSAFNGLTDLILAIVPIAFIWNLQLKLRVKITVAILLGMSILAFVGVIMKIVYLNALSHRGDASYNTVPMFAWVVVETILVQIAASTPLLRPLFKRMLGESFNFSSGPAGAYELPRRRRSRYNVNIGLSRDERNASQKNGAFSMLRSVNGSRSGSGSGSGTRLEDKPDSSTGASLGTTIGADISTVPNTGTKKEEGMSAVQSCSDGEEDSTYTCVSSSRLA